MATPTEKSEAIDEFLTRITGQSRKAQIMQDACAFCGGEAKEFADDLSRREYEISGICQSCQDKAFSSSEYDENDLDCDEE